ncbi:SMP-30/gluconolactonase/LRE family protein [Actinokineospora sp. NBRC 105648]|uniref:SMP-30/gluconolactonase/LRE family protein n=1 Tax=Actinokineospora sp. NBRC 105648 TaxID=3032206 RepID=UPI0024A3F868|nr:SMP-30/gluconolactonase/LRE family protein [Actinokineospora sp. NBRC 105648]GLZ37814.1 strictosidine synthase [Actinokineospora sp. NBRC 105648]
MARPKIEPVVWRAPRPGRKPAGNTLPELTVRAVNGKGAEDVLVDANGHIYTGVDDGRILRLTADGRRLDTIADTGGRPLGLEHHPDGRLLVCDADRGLLLVDRADGAIEVLVPAGPDLRVCNNAAVADDGTVYFSNSSDRFDLEFWKADLLEHTGTGRLLRRDPDGTVHTLLRDLQFANGVALTPDASAVVVADMWEYRLRRVWLTGERQGQSDVLVDNLPAFPDNISTGSDGLIWIAMASPRDPVIDLLLRTPPVLRKLLWRVPEPLQPKEKRVVWARAIDSATGAVVHDLHGTAPDFHMVTGVREHHGRVYLGSLEERAIAYFDLP